MSGTNDYLKGLYGAGGDEDIDPRIVNAGEILQKLAAEEGVDIDSMPDEDVASLLADIAGEAENEEEGGQQPQEEAKVAGEVTYAQVSQELAKVAAEEDVDLSALTEEDYQEAFDKVASDMTSDPHYVERREALQEKLAEADVIGRQMAHSFDDELQQKLSGTTIKDVNTLSGRALKAIRGAGSSVDTAAQNLGRRVSIAGVKARDRVLGGGQAYNASETALRAKGYGTAAAGAGAVGAAGYGGKKMYDSRKEKKKKSFDEAAMERARGFLYENGVDPDSGEKIASEEIDAAAYEILQEAGWVE